MSTSFEELPDFLSACSKLSKVKKNPIAQKYIQTDRQMGKWASGQVGWLVGRQAGRQADSQMDNHTGKCAH